MRNDSSNTSKSAALKRWPYLRSLGIFVFGVLVFGGTLDSQRDGVIPSRWKHDDRTNRHDDPGGFWRDIVIGYLIGCGGMYFGLVDAIDVWKARRSR